MIHAPIARTFATANTVYRRPASEVDNTRDYIPSADLFDHPPRHGRGLPARTFRVVSEYGHTETIHTGFGLTVEDVVAEESSHCYDPNDTTPDPLSAVDKTILEGGRVVAIMRDLQDGAGSYKVLRVDAVWSGVGELVPEADGIDGFAGAEAARLALVRSLPVAWTVMSAGELLFHCRFDMTLDQIIAEAICEGIEADVAIFRGSRLFATLRSGGADGEPEVIRFDMLGAAAV